MLTLKSQNKVEPTKNENYAQSSYSLFTCEFHLCFPDKSQIYFRQKSAKSLKLVAQLYCEACALRGSLLCRSAKT